MGRMILQCIGGHNEQKCAGIIIWMCHGETLHYYSWHLKIGLNNPWVKELAEGQFLVPDWGMELALVSGCRTSHPATPVLLNYVSV